MNIILYSLFLFGGIFLVYRELTKKRSSGLYSLPLALLFLVVLCSRIGHDQDYNDLNYYITYFLNDDDKYFEPGYVVFVSIVKTIFGYNPNAFIFCVGLFEVLFLFLAYRILSKPNTFDRVKNKKRDNKRWIVTRNLVIRRRILKKKKESAVRTNRCVTIRRNVRDGGRLSILVNFHGFIPLFFVYALYWGVSFGCEVLRLGMALCILFCAVAAVITNKPRLALVFFPLAFTFQYTSLGLIVAVLFFMFFKEPKKVTLWVVFLLGMLIDQAYTWGLLSASLGNTVLDKVLSAGEIFSHYDQYSGQDETTSALSLQYWAYHLFGALMLFGNLADHRYKRAVTIYIMGLFVGSLFNGSVFSMRLQWLFLPVIIFALFFFLRDYHYTLKTRLSVLGFYSVIEAVMAVRYLGFYL